MHCQRLFLNLRQPLNIRRFHCCYFIIHSCHCYRFCILPADGAYTTIARGRTAATAVYGGGKGLRSQHVSAIISAWVTRRLTGCSDVYDAVEDTVLKNREKTTQTNTSKYFEALPNVVVVVLTLCRLAIFLCEKCV